MSYFSIYIYEKNTNNYPPSIHPYHTGPRCWNKLIYAHQRTLHRGMTLWFTPPSKGSRGSSEKFLHKNERSFGSFTFPPETCLIGSQKNSDKTYKQVMVSHHWPFILRKRSELQKEECFIDDIPRNILHIPLLLLTTRRESPSGKKQPLDRSENFQTWKIAIESDPSLWLSGISPTPSSYVLPRKKNTEPRWELDWSGRRSDNKSGQIGSPVCPSR